MSEDSSKKEPPQGELPPSETLEPGLYILATPLGNLGDLSTRAVKILSASDLIASEDTRRTLKLLNYFKISRPLVSYREQNHNIIWPRLEKTLSAEKVVTLVSDAGAPVISDPGAFLIQTARKKGFRVIPVPGPSAVITALMASGFYTPAFTFGGFLPNRTKKRQEYLRLFVELPHPVVFFESPFRLGQALLDFVLVFGPHREAMLCREMTKFHEEYLSGSLAELALEVETHPRKGEVTIVVSGVASEVGSHVVSGHSKMEHKILPLAPGSGTGKEILENSPKKPFPEKLLQEKLLQEKLLNDPRPLKVIAKDWEAELEINKKDLYQLLLKLRNKES
ncbi:MAG: 16S rRNA (cytidine(1402)-2'-O)-methyltransferase [Deltaproteobacteria bacterium]|jgi:16S rRNA (cytidine1402-2'-O)-methyltransferase|nr:16S rRNA (cytidine(1402)-2'-O)-methyltransferase [Deltaproteobacteria bacterium]